MFFAEVAKMELVVRNFAKSWKQDPGRGPLKRSLYVLV